jgi:hypothetical protein
MALLALTYPLRLTAHLTDAGPRSRSARATRNAGDPAIGSDLTP